MAHHHLRPDRAEAGEDLRVDVDVHRAPRDPTTRRRSRSPQQRRRRSPGRRRGRRRARPPSPAPPPRARESSRGARGGPRGPPPRASRSTRSASSVRPTTSTPGARRTVTGPVSQTGVRPAPPKDRMRTCVAAPSRDPPGALTREGAPSSGSRQVASTAAGHAPAGRHATGLVDVAQAELLEPQSGGVVDDGGQQGAGLVVAGGRQRARRSRGRRRSTASASRSSVRAASAATGRGLGSSGVGAT